MRTPDVIQYSRCVMIPTVSSLAWQLGYLQDEAQAFDDVDVQLRLGDFAQEWRGDTRVLLFVQMQQGTSFDATVQQHIRSMIRESLSRRHVPAKIIAVEAVPLTVTGKVSEAAVRDAIHGRPVRNRDALANPSALAHFDPARLPDIHAP